MGLTTGCWMSAAGVRGRGPEEIQVGVPPTRRHKARRLDKASQGVQEGTGPSRDLRPSSIQPSGRGGWSGQTRRLGTNWDQDGPGQPCPPSRHIPQSPGANQGPRTTCRARMRGLTSQFGRRLERPRSQPQGGCRTVYVTLPRKQDHQVVPICPKKERAREQCGPRPWALHRPWPGGLVTGDHQT